MNATWPSRPPSAGGMLRRTRDFIARGIVVDLNAKDRAKELSREVAEVQGKQFCPRLALPRGGWLSAARHGDVTLSRQNPHRREEALNRAFVPQCRLPKLQSLSTNHNTTLLL